MAPSMPTDYKAKVILGWTTLHFAEETESWKSVETLLNGGASTRDLITTKRKLKDPLRAPVVLRDLCRHGCLKLLRFALSENPELVQTRLDMSRTLLHVATQAGSSVAVRCLMDYPAVDVNASDGRGVTPLHEAAAHCNAYVMMQLLKAGANAHAKDVDGRTALHYAASGGSASGIRILLSEGLAPDVESTNGCSPLHEAASSSNHHCVQLLLNAGADLNMTTNAGWTALHWAASKGTVRSLRILLEAGIPVGSKTHQDETALHLAAERGHSDMVSLLVSHGADVEALDSEGRTPAKRASDRLQQQQQQQQQQETKAAAAACATAAAASCATAAAASCTTAAAAKEEVLEETKKHRRRKKIGNSSQIVASEKTNTELQTSAHSEMLQGDDTQSHSDEAEDSEYSYQSESEISGQRYSDSDSDFEEEYQLENASGGTPTGKKPPSLLSVETKIVQPPNQGRGNAHRGKYRGRGGHVFVRGQKSGSRGGGRGQSQERYYAREEYTQNHGKAQYTGYVNQEEHHTRHRRRHRQVKEEEARREYNNQSSAGEPRRKEHLSRAAGEDTRKKHPFSKDRQRQTTRERETIQTIVPNTGIENLQKVQAFGSSDKINRGKTDHIKRHESRSGGTFLDELRYLQEKLNIAGAEPNHPPKPKQNQYGPAKPGL